MLKLKDPSLLKDRCYVNGQWIVAAGGRTVAVSNPADRSAVGTVPDLGADETRAAIDAANTT